MCLYCELHPQASPPPLVAGALPSRKWFLPQDPEEPQQLGSHPQQGVLHVCLQRVGQLELWLRDARSSPVAMQDNVEQQLLTCQEMFLEIEHSVSGLSPADRLQDEAVELLSSKLELLKTNLVSFQRLLQDRQREERREPQGPRDPQESQGPRELQRPRELQEPPPQAPAAPPPRRLQRSSSVQEVFSSPRNKLLRQSSLQQQKEFEQQLSEQRGLTQAIAQLGGRGQSQGPPDQGPQGQGPQGQGPPDQRPQGQRPQGPGPEAHSALQQRSPPAEADEEEDAAHRKWDVLHSRLLALEEFWLLPPSEVADSSTRRRLGAAGHLIGSEAAKELQIHGGRLRELGLTADQTSFVGGTHRTLDEGLFLVLTSITSRLQPLSGTPQEGDAEPRQLESVSAELVALGSDLASQGSKVSGLLGSEARRCVDALGRVLPAVRSSLSSREKQLSDQQGELTRNRAVVELQEALQQQVSSLLLEAHLSPSLAQQASRLQGELDSSLGGVLSHREELSVGVELQRHYERLVHGLEGLLALGAARLARRPDDELHGRAQLQQQLAAHMKFSRFLGHHLHILQQLTRRVPDSALQRWEGVVTGLQSEVARLQRLALEEGTRMQETIEWEEDSAWSDSSLTAIETSFPKMHQWGGTEELSVYRVVWTLVSVALERRLLWCRGVLPLWEEFGRLAAASSDRLQTLQSHAEASLSGAAADEDSVERLAGDLQRVQSLLQSTDALQADLEEVLEASKELVGHLEPPAAALVQSESRLLSRGVQQLGQRLRRRRSQLQEELGRLQEFEDVLASLEEKLELGVERLQQTEDRTTDQAGLLQLSGPSADLSVLNEQSCVLTLGDGAARRLRRLNQRWAAAAAGAEEACSERQAEALRQQSFQQQCESWMSFLQRMEEELVEEVSGSYRGLREQLCTHQRFQAELSCGHLILHSVITEALQLLHRGEVEDRTLFLLKLARLREQWQGAVQRAEQRRSLVEGLHTELLFQRHQSGFIHTLEVGRQLFSMGDQESQTQLQTELGALQDEWDQLHGMLGRRLQLTEAVVQRASRELTEREELWGVLTARCGMQENEGSLEDWVERLTELSTMKTDLSQYVIAEDVLLLQEQVEQLHCQWEELCLKASLRKQEVAGRLNAWVVFHEKNQELCEWLTQMENKVERDHNLDIEEMVEKLKKDCMEEMSSFSESKAHLQQLGEQLVTANRTEETEEAKETEVHAKLGAVNERWQHLFDHIEAR
ncbi:Nesprin-2 [Liparis tanakae]|uniref:Nesprin-2 n=1 Tax=Liparis tanakae TaxID=230148 RepID=A0A4Z2FHV4_9TELE|nr:Nesprin-2 [Liparis tanakae]